MSTTIPPAPRRRPIPRDRMAAALHATAGNIARAARALGCSREYLARVCAADPSVRAARDAARAVPEVAET